MWLSRIISLMLFLGNFGVALLIKDEKVQDVFGRVSGAGLMGVICVWFGDEMGNWMGTFRLHQVTAPTPGGVVRFMGWVLLFVPYIAFLIYKFS
ncbi:MAG: hypothetical protein JXB29_05235 [Sedimentisphaerales bacterium]|nr:hypothetical protein [Sedimentisphaerales bacterium]